MIMPLTAFVFGTKRPTTLEHVADYFRRHPGETTTSVRVARALGRPVRQVHAALAEAVSRGLLVLRDDGSYEAVRT